jgi:hypothetical protein
MCTALTLTAGAERVASAQELSLDKIQVHGYGGWSFGRTTDNLNTNFYLFAHARGDYFHNEFALNVTAPLNDRLTIVAQPFWHSGHHANQTSSGIDYVFGEWKFADQVRLRVGNVKQPFGIYTEIFDVGTLRPFATAPQSIYGPGGMIGKSYSGMGLTGALFAERAWGIDYDVYGGGLETLEEDTPLQVLVQGTDTVGTTKALNFAGSRTFRDVIGGRVVFRTPFDGLSFGASSYTGTRPLTKLGQAKDWRRTTSGVHAELVTDAWSLRSELAKEKDEANFTANGGYGEAAYRLTQHWQVAATYGTYNTTLENVSAANIALAPTLLDHKETAGGLNYWFSPNFVVKTSYSHVDGNRFSHPDPTTRLRALATGSKLMTTTDAVLVSGHLSF